MRKYMVPQFIEAEDKILGPITVRQFVLLVIWGVLEFLFFRFAPLPTFILATIILSGIVGPFTFIKINGALFHEFLLNILTTFKKPNLRVWNKNLSNEELYWLTRKPKEEAAAEVLRKKEKPASSRLAELSLIVDTEGRYKGE